MYNGNAEDGYYGLRNLSVMDDEESRIQDNCVYLKQVVINNLWPFVKANEPAAAYAIAIKEWLKGMTREEVIGGIKKWAPEFLNVDHDLITLSMTEEQALKKYMDFLKTYEPGLRGEKNELGNIMWVPDAYRQAVTNGTVEEFAKKEIARDLREAKEYQEELPEIIEDLIKEMIEIYDLLMRGENFLQHSALEDVKRQLVKGLKPLFNWSAPDETEPPPVSEIDGKENLT